nr:uncharacterized protein LOC107436796 [Parasteatoda tepidariorum]
MYFRNLAPLLRRNPILMGRMCHQRFLKQSSEPPAEKKDEPIKFSTSKAGQWKARYTSAGEDYDDTPRIQGLVIVVSLAAFMIHFCILREENDLDDFLRYAESNVPLALQEAQLQIEIEQHKQKHADYTELQDKLLQVRKMKKELKQTMNVQ